MGGKTLSVVTMIKEGGDPEKVIVNAGPDQLDWVGKGYHTACDNEVAVIADDGKGVETHDGTKTGEEGDKKPKEIDPELLKLIKDMTVIQMKDAAAKLGAEGFNQMKKADLIQFLAEKEHDPRKPL